MKIESKTDISPTPCRDPFAEGWRGGVAKALEHEFSAFLPQSARTVP